MGFPKGYDAYGHMSKIKFLVDNFPNVDWNYEWYSGQFFSEGSFPPLFHYLAGVLVGWFGLSSGAALIGIAAASFVTIGCALYGFVRVAGGSRVGGLIAALTLLAANAYWSYVLEDGLYPRILGMAFLTLFAFFAIVYSKRPSSQVLVAMVLTLAGALSTHLLLGAIAVAISFVLIGLKPSSLRQKFIESLKLLVPTALVVAYFYVPYALALSRPAPVPTFTREYSPVTLGSLLAPGAESLPLLMVLLAVLAPVEVFWFRQLPGSPVGRRTMIAVALAALASLVYALVGLPAPHVFIYNFQPGQALFFASWFLAALIGLSLSRLSERPRIAGAVVAALAAQIVLTGPGMAGTIVNGDNPQKRELQNALLLDSNQRDYRVGVSFDNGSDWINGRVGVPQTRGYQQQGVVNGVWQYWLDTRVWSRDMNYDEADFLLDWYAVKQFYGGPDAAVANRFAARPDLYAQTSAQTFDYLQSTPIMSARSTRTALVIADDASYSLVVRSLALSGFDSWSLIPIHGGAYLDDRSATELAMFDMVILYGYRFHDESVAFRLLDAYVERGGGLIIEGGNPALEQTGSAPAPVPGGQIKRKGIGPDWKLQRVGQTIGSGLDLKAFAPAVYNGGPWGVSYIPQASVPAWAEPVLMSDGDPVMVAGILGSGRVVWSGMNLPYHIESTRTVEESRLLSQAIVWTTPRQAAEPDYTATFVNPKLRRVVVAGPASGILLKESWVPNWQASVNGKSVDVYRAGPDLMYVPLPPGAVYPATVELQFTRTPVELISDVISLLALVGLLGSLVVGSIRARRRARSTNAW